MRLLESQLKLACANEVPGEGRALIAYRTLERANLLSVELRKRVDAIYRFIDDPGREEREAGTAQLTQRIALLRERIQDEAAALGSTGRSPASAGASDSYRRSHIREMMAELESLRAARNQPGEHSASWSPRSQELQQYAQRDMNGLAGVLNRLDVIANRANSCYATACNLGSDPSTAICGEGTRMREIAANRGQPGAGGGGVFSAGEAR
jgi:hypothetical protein